MSLVLRLFALWAEQKRVDTELSRCIRHRSKENRCSKCLDHCPSPHAIQIEEAPVWSADQCTECMHCTTVCPTQAFQDKRFMESVRSISNRRVVRFSCEKNGSRTTEVLLPCVYQVDLIHLIMAQSVAEKVVIRHDREACRECPSYVDIMENKLELVIEAARDLGLGINQSQDTKNVGDKDDGEQVVSRRDFLRGILTKATDETRTLLPSFNDSQSLRVGLTVPEKRKLLLHLLEGLPAEHSAHTAISRHVLGAARIEVSEDCNLCGKCEAICPTGALQTEEQAGLVTLHHLPKDCLNCGLCKEACGKQVLNYEDKVPLSMLLDALPVVLHKGNPYSKEQLDNDLFFL